MINRKTLLFCAISLINFNASALIEELESKNTSYYLRAQYNPILKIHENFKGPAHVKSNFPNIDFALGLATYDHYRLEIASGYRSFKYNNTVVDDELMTSRYNIHRLDLYRTMINAYIDGPKFYDTFTPYIMGGIGYAHIKKRKLHFTHNSYLAKYGIEDIYDHSSTTISGKNFASQFGVGVSSDITDKIKMDVGIVYAKYGKVRFANEHIIDAKTAKLSDIELSVGVRYSF